MFLYLNQLFLFQIGFFRIFDYAGNTAAAAGLCCVALGNADDLSVGGLQAEAVFSALVLIKFKFGMLGRDKIRDRLVLNMGKRCILLDRGHTVAAGRLCGIDLRPTSKSLGSWAGVILTQPVPKSISA